MKYVFMVRLPPPLPPQWGSFFFQSYLDIVGTRRRSSRPRTSGGMPWPTASGTRTGNFSRVLFSGTLSLPRAVPFSVSREARNLRRLWWDRLLFTGSWALRPELRDSGNHGTCVMVSWAGTLQRTSYPNHHLLRQLLANMCLLLRTCDFG